jgi:hypothetical protein
MRSRVACVSGYTCRLTCRLLRGNVAEAERIINPPLAAVSAFSEALTSDMRDALFAEFNTLSVVYQLPAAHFLQEGPTGAAGLLLARPSDLGPAAGKWEDREEEGAGRIGGGMDISCGADCSKCLVYAKCVTSQTSQVWTSAHFVPYAHSLITHHATEM